MTSEKLKKVEDIIRKSKGYFVSIIITNKCEEYTIDNYIENNFESIYFDTLDNLLDKIIELTQPKPAVCNKNLLHCDWSRNFIC